MIETKLSQQVILFILICSWQFALGSKITDSIDLQDKSLLEQEEEPKVVNSKNKIPKILLFDHFLIKKEVETKCFDDLGCISSDEFYDKQKIIPVIPTTKQMNVTFFLFTPNTRDSPQVFKYEQIDSEIPKSLFDAERKTKLIIHGYMSKYDENEWPGVRPCHFTDGYFTKYNFFPR